MSDFQTVVVAEDAAPDLRKHVNYVQGMVLGVDDFTQEFAYLDGRVQWLAREAIGYGSLSGLHVTVEDTGDGPRVRVSEGVALTPRGELVCVPEDQCALINPWLAGNQDKLPPGGTATLHVRLCYTTCATDNLPIPGEPCRSEDELMAPSRIVDDFRLELDTTAPDQREEDAVRAFATWLRAVRLTSNPGEAISEDAFARAVRDAWLPGGTISSVPPETLAIPVGRESDYLRLALRVWTTELRPGMRALGGGCATPPDEGCISLATLSVDLTGDRLEALVMPGVHDEGAPFLLHLRMLQEWLIAGWHNLLPSDTVSAETVYGLVPDAGMAEEYARADHTHGTPPPPELTGEVESLPDGFASSPPGELTGSPPGPADELSYRIHTRVARIYGEAVGLPDGTVPTAGQVLKLVDQGDGTLEWRPADDNAGGTTGPEPGADADLAAEQRYNLAPDPGTSLTYARSDHTHGTPPAPELTGEVESVPDEDGNSHQLNTRVTRIHGEAVGLPDGETLPTAGQVLKLIDTGDGALEWRPADDNAGGGTTGPERGTAVDLKVEQRYNQTADLGRNLTYAPSDHTHGTPPAPTFSGEVEIQVVQSSDTVQEYTTRVAEILGFPVEGSDHVPAAGDILTLVPTGRDSFAWRLGSGQRSGRSFVVAAGQFKGDGAAVSSFGGLEAIRVAEVVYALVFPAYKREEDYVVTGTPWAALREFNPHVFEYLGKLDDVIADDNVDQGVRDRLARLLRDRNGLVVRAQQMRFELNEDRGVSRVHFFEVDQGFMVEISHYPRGG